MKQHLLILVALCTTINALAENCPTGYYDAIYGKKDAALKTALYNVIRPHTAIPYGNGKGKTWEVFYYSDRDSNGYCMDMYCDDWKQFTEIGAVVDGCNIEHSFAKSWWGKTENDAYKDCYHLNPSNKEANSSRDNYPLGEPTTNIQENTGSLKVGQATYGGQLIWVFEPKDEYKGDFARAYLYMATCYGEELTWNKSNPSIYSYYAMRSSTDANAYLEFEDWEIEVLLKWHRQDSVSEKEIKRMDAVSDFQHNRNPFIDHPEWVEYIWGNKKGQVLSKDSTQTTVAVTGISLSPTTLSLSIGKTAQLTPTIRPADATNTSITWSTSNPSVATVQNSVVTGVAEGEATITATTEDGSFAATCVVTITPNNTDSVYSITEVIAAYNAGSIVTNDEVYVRGYISSILVKPNNFNNYHSAIIWLSSSKGTSRELELYNCQGMVNVNFSTFEPYAASGSTTIDVTSITDVNNNVFTIGDQIEAFGKIVYFNNTIYELSQGCYITRKIEAPTVDVSISLPSDWDAPAVYSWDAVSSKVTAMTKYKSANGYTWWTGVVPSDAEGFLIKNSVDKDTWDLQTVDISVPTESTCYALGTLSTKYEASVADCYVDVTGITLNATTASVMKGNNLTLVPTLTPSNATNKNITWTTSKASVATVINGIVSGVAVGTATITATAQDGSFAASCQVTVTPNEATIQVISANTQQGVAFGSGTYTMNTQVIVGASAFEGYCFDHWSDGDTVAARKIEVTQNLTLTAYFTTYKVDTVTLHDTTYIDVHDTTYVDVHDTTYVDVHDTTYVDVHDTTYINLIEVNALNPTMGTAILQIYAIAEEGYKFLNWTDLNTDNPRTIETSNEPRTFTAVFEEDNSSNAPQVKADNATGVTKRIVNDRLQIERNGVVYDATGR